MHHNSTRRLQAVRVIGDLGTLAAALLIGYLLPGTSDATAQVATILNVPTVAVGEAYDPGVHGTSLIAEQQAAIIGKAWGTETATMPWTSLMLAMTVKHKVSPTRSARGLALLHVAMHDAWKIARDDGTRKMAISAAAANVLGYLFTTEEHGFERILSALIASESRAAAWPPGALAQALRSGREVGRLTVARGEGDGAARGWNGVRLQWYGEGRYYGPGAWEPTAPYFYYPPDEPFAPGWRTWILKTPGQFRPVPPPFGSARYIKDLREVVKIQASLSSEQISTARFWVDGSGSVTPPGHWNQIAADLVRRHKTSDDGTVRLFAILNMALADTFIAVWDAKYHYWTARPITAAKTVYGIDLNTAILTPPFPSYVSGHAAFSGAAARVLGAFYPDDAQRLQAMAEAAAHSRLLGGIHFRHDNEDGLVLGRAVASEVLEKFGL